MSKRYSLLILLICIFAMCGCARTKEASVTQSNDCWTASDIMLNNLPPDADICGITDEGIYYSAVLRTEMHGPELRDDLAWHFLSYSGEDITICETPCVYYYNDLQNDTDLILNISYLDEENVTDKVLVLSSDGTVKEAAGENACCIYASGEYLLIQQPYREENQWLEHLILLDTAAGTKTTVYEAVCGYDERDGLGDGEQLGCASLNDKEVLLMVKALENGRYRQGILHRYDIAEKSITDTIEVDASYAVCSEDLLLSEKNKQSADSLDPDHVISIGRLAKGQYQELSEFPIPFSSGMFFNSSALSKNGYYLTSYSSVNGSYCHFWNTDTNKLYVYEFGETEVSGRSFPTSQGIRFVTQKDDNLYVRTLSIK